MITDRRYIFRLLLLLIIIVTGTSSICYAKEKEKSVVLRVCNWEEYIDLGDWDDDEAIDLSDDNVIIGVNSMIEDFEEWYYKNYNVRCKVLYSTFGTNEELYNQMNLGDTYDIACPSEYMIMKLLDEDRLLPYDRNFFDENIDNNYYIKGVSPYIKHEFETNEINGEKWSKYAAGYMWGITGIVYNPELVTREEASTCQIIRNPKFNRRVTIKDNVRDAYFAALSVYKSDLLLNKDFRSSSDYKNRLADEMNDVKKDTINEVQDILVDMKNNVYSFETDSGKSDMVTGKIVANYQWSGDAVYALDQAEEDGFYLDFAVPRECTNLWFDGWVMLKDGIGEDQDKKQAAQAFVNFLSRPDNVVRNMYYIGYTSVISGGQDSTVFDYVDWCYSADDDCEDVTEYSVNYFFSDGSSDKDYVLTVEADQPYRQLGAQYPSENDIKKSAIMRFFDKNANRDINKMWINVRCFNIKDVPVPCYIVFGITALFMAGILVKKMICNKKKV